MMHLIRPLLLLLAVLVLLVVCEHATGDTVRIYDVTGSNGPDILLSQVAELDGEYASQFANVVVGTLPEGEAQVELATASILSAMQAQGASLGRIDLRGFGRCTVHRTFAHQSRADVSDNDPPVMNVEARVHGEAVTLNTPMTVRALIERQIAERLGLGLHEMQITFNDRDRVLLNQSAVAGRFDVEPVVEPALGAVSFRVYAYRGTQRVDNGQMVTGRVQQRVLAVIAGSAIQRDTPINRRQVRLTEVLIDRADQVYLSDPSVVTGLVASRNIEPGELITSDQIQMPIAVHRRQRVTVELRSGGIRISFNGMAHADGAIGDTVEVENLQTGERITATVIARGRVEAGIPTSQERQGEE